MQGNITGTLIIEGFCFSLILMVYFNNRGRRRLETPDRTIFRYLIVSALVVTVLDALTWIINGQIFPYCIMINRVITAACHFSVPLLMFLWVLYLDYKVNNSIAHLKKNFYWYAVPLFISFIIFIIDLFSDRFFMITDQNVYQRNDAYIITILLMAIYIIHSFFYVLSKRKCIQKRDYRALLFFPIPMVIASILQTFQTQISCLIMGLTFSLIIIFVYQQNKIIIEDSLTKLSNRLHMEDYVTAELLKLTEDQALGGIMLDMDHFKSINDTFGHAMGDIALESMSQVMRSSARNSDLCARLSGDEFLIIAKIQNESDLNLIINRLQQKTDAFNTSRTTPFTLAYSYGAYVATHDANDTLETFLRKLDFRMYADKSRKRDKERR